MTKLRVQMRVKLYKDGTLVDSARRTIKSRVMAFVQEHPTSEWDCGTIRVVYSKNGKFWNESDFYDLDDLRESLTVFTEKDLLDYMSDIDNEDDDSDHAATSHTPDR